MKNTIWLLFIGLSLGLQAQNRLSGTVTDSLQQPIKGASVSAPDLHNSTVTDGAGHYYLNNLPSGNIRVTFSFVGYTTQQVMAWVSGADSTLDITLQQTEFEMDEVVVSTAFSRLQSQNVMKVEKQGVVEMRKRGASTLIEGLTTIPGVAQVSTGTSIGKPVIRGLSGNRVLVYTQGIRMENQQFGDEHGLGLNDSGIESAEVIKGPASLLYGPDALGGVLYLNPEKFADANTFKGDFNERLFSNTLGSNTSLGVKGSGESWKFLVRASHNTHSDYKIPEGNRVTNTRYNEEDIKGAIGYNNSFISSVLRYNFNHLDLGIPEEGIASQSDSKNTLYPRQGVDSHILSLNNSFFLGRSKADLNLGYISNDRSEFEDRPTAVLHMKLTTFNWDFKYHFRKWGSIETILGAQGMHQENKNFGKEYLIPDALTHDIGFFGTANCEWGVNVFQAGLRYDNRRIESEAHGIVEQEGSFAALDRSFDSFNASAGYKRDLSSKSTLRLNLASGFRAPNLAELTSNGVHEGTNRYEMGTPSLKNEQNVQADLNLEYKDSHWEFFVNGFYNHINHYIFAAPTGEIIDGNDLYRYMQSSARLFGGEAGLHFHPHPLDWLHLETAFESVTGKKDNGDYLPLVPANNWSNTIRTEFTSGRWLTEWYTTLNVSHTFKQGNVSGFEAASPGYTLVNLAFGGKINFGKPTFNLSLNGNNIFDKTYIAHLSRLKTDGIPNIGRNVVIAVGFAF